MATIAAYATGATCGLACWWAEQESCHCSCKGAAHGVLALGGTQPRRNCLINGRRYVLGAVAQSWSAVNNWAHDVTPRDSYGYSPQGEGNVPGAIWFHRAATAPQRSRWPELIAYREVPYGPHLTWIREDWAERFDAALPAMQ